MEGPQCLQYLQWTCDFQPQVVEAAVSANREDEEGGGEGDQNLAAEEYRKLLRVTWK